MSFPFFSFSLEKKGGGGIFFLLITWDGKTNYYIYIHVSLKVNKNMIDEYVVIFFFFTLE